MITRKFKINASDNSASISPNVVLYKGDTGVLLNLTLENFPYTIEDICTIKATVFNKENGKLVLQNDLYLKLKENDLNNKETVILFPIWDDSFDLDVTGAYFVQMHIYDEKGNRISVPSFNIEVRDTIY